MLRHQISQYVCMFTGFILVGKQLYNNKQNLTTFSSMFTITGAVTGAIFFQQARLGVYPVSTLCDMIFTRSTFIFNCSVFSNALAVSRLSDEH